MKKIILLLLCVFLFNSLMAQSWVEMVGKPGANFYDIQKAFYEYYKDKDINVKGNGYKQFKRWEYIVEPRVYPSGELSVMDQASKNYADFLREYYSFQNNNKSSSTAMSATWMPVGPMGSPTGSLGGIPCGAGKDNAIVFHPTNTLTIYACSANGGLWESTNGGVSWSTNHELLPTGAVTDLLIDPGNPSVMYLATGGGDSQLSAYQDPSAGVYKTTNGGLTWLPTSLSYTFSQTRFIHKMAMDPNNTQVIYVATNAGLFRTSNGGASFSLVQSGNIWDVKIHPGNANIVYAAASSTFYRSTNGGISFTAISAGVPTSGGQRMRIAVTAANPSCVYVLACKSSDSNFMGVYKSVDDGATFVTSSTSPNIIGNSCAGTSTGPGIGWWNLAIAASPSNSNEIVVSGVNIWRSSNGGVTWTNIGCCNSPGSIWEHADVHDVKYAANGTLYAANDGGIYMYNGSSWTSLNTNRNIAEIYKIGLSSLTTDLWLTGHQDNGTSRNNSGTYNFVAGSDGMDCFIDRTNDLNMFSSAQNGGLRRSTNGGNSWSAATSGLTGFGGWVTPWKQDPQNANTLYCGYTQMFKSTNLGASWSQMGTIPGSSSIVEFAVAPSNNQVIYVLQSGIRKTINGGTTWSNTAGVGGIPTFITIDPSDENTAWVTVSGYSAGNKVFQTVDGGASWINVSANLPNLPANCSVYEPGSNDRIYVGMDIGIYYKDNSSPNWTLYNAGLPNVSVMDMEMTPAAPGQIFAATFGRGVYQADVVATTAAPSPSFSYYGALCTGVQKTLVDNSSNTPTNWNWTITPNNGVTFNSTSVQNPTVLFTNPGTYTLSLASGNSFGPGPTYTQTVFVYTTPTLNLSTGNSITVCQLEPVTITASGALTYTWSNGGGNANSATYYPNLNWTYTVTGSNNGCMTKETIAVLVETCLGISESRNELDLFSVYPNPAINMLTILSSQASDVSIKLMDVSGRVIKEQAAHFTVDKNEIQLNISALSSGNYILKIDSEQGLTRTIQFVKE